MSEDFKYYSLDYLDQYHPDAHYNMIFGERSNGKTSAVLERILYNWVHKGEKGAYIRRLDVDVRGQRAQRVWESIGPSERDLVSKYTNGEWENILYSSGAWYLSKYDHELKRPIKDNEPFCYIFAINVSESNKGNTFPEVTTVLFDEFLSRGRYLKDEFVAFSSILSTIIRQRDNVKIYMLGNTVNMYSPYFDEMGLEGADEMRPGEIKKYLIKNKDKKKKPLQVVVQYCKPQESGKDSDVYFQFDSKTSKMITSGEWEIPMYPHLPLSYVPRDIVDVFFIEFRDKIVQGEIIAKDDNMFIYMHRKTTPLKDDVKMLYKLAPSPKINHAISLRGPVYRNKVAAMIGKLIKEGQIYYQDNQLGELMRNYEQLAMHAQMGPS